MTLRITSEPSTDVDLLLQHLIEHNLVATHDYSYRPVRLFVRDEDGAVQGGLSAHLWGGWMYIEYLWVSEKLRGQDYGSKLLMAAEAEARAHNCQHVHLDTFSFQARPFYEKHGYRVFGELEDYPPGHNRYFLRKDL